MRILIINGPNLNMLGKREPHIYGTRTLEDINGEIKSFAAALGAEAEFFQSNSEGGIIDAIQKCGCPIVINAGAYTHYSYAIADALKSVPHDKIEVHISNLYTREEFRHKSVLSCAVSGVIAGLGAEGYLLAVRKLTGKI